MMSLIEFMALNASKGVHWFKRDTMRFFGTRVSNWDAVTGLFITSEQPPHGARAYSVRRADFVTGNVSTVGEFCGYRTLGAAKTAWRAAMRPKPVPVPRRVRRRSCDQCVAAMINGVFCHETGCPNAKR